MACAIALDLVPAVMLATEALASRRLARRRLAAEPAKSQHSLVTAAED
jgi:hypothetical protein